MEKYEIISSNRQVFDSARSWNEAVDKAVDLSLRWGSLFRVRNTQGGKLPFEAERRRVLTTSMEYIEIARLHPKSITADKARHRFEVAKRKLDQALTAFGELQGSDLVERHGLAHPIKAFRTDN